MKQNRTFEQMVNELERVKNERKDLLVPLSGLKFEGKNLVIPGGDEYKINPIALQQLLKFLEIPEGYFHRANMIQDIGINTTLGEVMINDHLFSKQNKKDVNRFVRILDGEVIAFLSDSYDKRLDNYPVFHEFHRVFEQLGLPLSDIKSAALTDKHLYIKVTTPRLSHKVLGEPIQGGFMVRNSEVGWGLCDASLFVEVLECTNGMVVTKSEGGIRYRHVGKKMIPTTQLEIPGTEYSDAVGRLSNLRQTLESIMEGSTFNKLIEKYNSVGEQIVKQDSLKEFLEDYKVRERIIEDVYPKDYSKWELSNVITRMSQGERDYEVATDLERIGHLILT